MVEETVEIDDNYYLHKYQYLDILLSDNINNIKIAIQPFKPKRYITFGVVSMQLAYEQKLHRTISLVNEFNGTSFWGDGEKINEFGYALGTRWYPYKNKQIKNGQSGNNSNGAYLGLKVDNIFKILTLRETSQLKTVKRHFEFDPSPELSIGYQNKFSQILYIDTNFFFNYNIQSASLGYGITLLIGTSFNINE